MSFESFPALSGEWPVLGPVTAIPDSIIQQISSGTGGLAITSNLGYLSLGLFFIDVGLIEPHPTQRQIDSRHVDTLMESFESRGIMRLENPGVIIGLGLGWSMMKNSTPIKYKIGSASPHLHRLSLTSNGPIGQVIRGGHRTEAIRRFSQQPEKSGEAYWLYEVLVPGKLFGTFNEFIYIILSRYK